MYVAKDIDYGTQNHPYDSQFPIMEDYTFSCVKMLELLSRFTDFGLLSSCDKWQINDCIDFPIDRNFLIICTLESRELFT